MSGLSQRDKEDIIDSVIKSRPSKLSGTLIAIAGGIVGGSISLVAEQIIGDTKDTLGWNMSLVEAEEGITRSTEEGRYIFAGGKSLTPYNLLSNKLASELDEQQYFGYGWVVEGGSSINLQTINSRSYPLSIAIAQADVYAEMRDDNELDDTSIIMNTGIPECAFTVGEYLTFAELAEAAQRAAWGEGEKIVIGMPNSNSGSFVTAHNITEYGLDPDGIEIRDGYVGTDKLLDAYENGEVDVAVFVQYPAAVNRELRGGMQRVINEEFNIVAMDTMSYNFSFRDLPYGYNLLQVTLPKNTPPGTDNNRRRNDQTDDSVDPALANLRQSKPMLCTEVLLAAQNITTVTDILERGTAINLHGTIQQRLSPEDLQFPDMPDFEVLGQSTKPIEISYNFENTPVRHAGLPGAPADDGLQIDWMNAIKPEEMHKETYQLDYALMEDMDAQPNFD